MDENAHAVIAVAECGSVVEAARLVHVSQPALSKRIRTLEEALGVRLFDRSRHPLELTEAGKAYLGYAREVVAAERSMLKEVELLAGRTKRHLNVGVSVVRVDELMTEVAARFYRLVPECTLRLVPVNGSEHLNALLTERRIDFACLTPCAPDPVLFASHAILSESIQLVAPTTMEVEHRCDEGGVRRVSLKSLADLPFIMLPKDWHITRLLLTAMDTVNVRLNPVMHVCTVGMALEMVRRGYGVAVATMPQRLPRPEHGLRRYEIDELRGGDGLLLAHRKDWCPGRDAEVFMGLVSDYIARLTGMPPKPLLSGD